MPPETGGVNIIQIIFGIAIAFAVPGITWFLIKRITTQLGKDIKEIQTKQSILRENLPIEYVRRADYISDIKEIKILLEKIFDKLDAKMDKQ